MYCFFFCVYIQLIVETQRAASEYIMHCKSVYYIGFVLSDAARSVSTCRKYNKRNSAKPLALRCQRIDNTVPKAWH